ncbi:MAG TPA: hypothetical protein ENF83_00175, partial [Candidatus Korarchaeota archaeon]|nr:hypothetical protein [Candidatus Korarchaeota archaeon]
MASRLRALAALTLILTQLAPLATVLSQGAVPDVEVESIAPDKVGECLPANFTVRLANGGDGNATNVVLRVSLPGGVTYVQRTGRVNGTPVEPTISGGDLVWNISEAGYDPLDPGDRLDVEFNLSAGCSSLASTDLTPTVTYEDDEGNPYASSDTS